MFPWICEPFWSSKKSSEIFNLKTSKDLSSIRQLSSFDFFFSFFLDTLVQCSTIVLAGRIVAWILIIGSSTVVDADSYDQILHEETIRHSLDDLNFDGCISADAFICCFGSSKCGSVLSVLRKGPKMIRDCLPVILRFYQYYLVPIIQLLQTRIDNAIRVSFIEFKEEMMADSSVAERICNP